MIRCFGIAILFVALAACAEPAKKPNIVLVAGEYEYFSTNSLPALKKYLESDYPLQCVYLKRKDEQIPGLAALETADLAIFFIRRMTLPEEELAQVKKYVDSGKPLIALRTSSHAFENWKEFDPQVLGGNYKGHHGNDAVATARIVPEAASHPILKNVAKEFVTGGSLYKTSPLANDTTRLLMGSVTNQPPEPIAWTRNHKGARIFYTSLGHPKDFENSAFRQMLVNAIYWALDSPIPARAQNLADREPPIRAGR
jgi:type 1 glutamine amidotransferase